jgi:hypothetical protein
VEKIRITDALMVESPFLSETMFTREIDTQWEERASALAAESGFEASFRGSAAEELQAMASGLEESAEHAETTHALDEPPGDGDFEVEVEQEPGAGLAQKLKVLSLLPHLASTSSGDVALKPSLMDPMIYQGPDSYKIAPALQDLLKEVMKKPRFRPMQVALVDLTKGVMLPEFAGSFDHKKQVDVASLAKLAPMLGALQLRHDLRAAFRKPGPRSLDALFARVRDEWATTQRDPGGKPTPFTRGISLRGKLVLRNGALIPLTGPKSPRLEEIFRPLVGGAPIQFSSSNHDEATLLTIVEAFNAKVNAASAARRRARSAATATPDGQKKLDEAERRYAVARRAATNEFDAYKLGFWERLGVSVGGDVPASNYATSTVIRDVGFPYIASTLLQTGLYDTNRGGGLWLGGSYWGTNWIGAPGGGSVISGTAGSLAAFLTLIAQRRLVSHEASEVMEFFMHKIPSNPFPGTGSWFEEGLRPLGGVQKLAAKVGLSGGSDECAYIEREVDDGTGDKKRLRYVAVVLRARAGNDVRALILELDKCILANNGLVAAQGVHP